MKKREIDFNKYFMPNLKLARKRIESAKHLDDVFFIPENIQNIGIDKKYHIRTYGCQSNLRDTETMKGII